MASLGHGLELEPQVLRGVLDETRLLILVADREGLVAAANPAVEQATGLSEQALLRPIWELATIPDERVSLQKTFSPLTAEALPSSLLFHLITNGEKSRVVDWDVRVLRDDGEIAGAVFAGIDLSDRLAVEQNLRESETLQRMALKVSEGRLRGLVDSNVIGIIFWNERGDIAEANEAFLRLLGFTRDELLSGAVSWRDLTPPEYRVIDQHAINEILATGKCPPYEKEYFAKDGTRVPVLIGAARVDASPEGPIEGVAFILDLREQVQLRNALDQLLAKEQRARIETETANARLLLLVEGSKRLSRTMSVDETLQTLASLVIPSLADWCYVVHRGWEGRPMLVASAHGNPTKENILRRLHSCMPDPAAPEGAPKVFRTGEIALYSDITTEQLSPVPPAWPIVGTRDPEHLHILREVGMKSLLCVPIQARSGVGGVDAVMMLVSTANPHRYDEDDIILARDLAGRAAVSLENGRLLSEALDAVRARDDFLAIAAHELRTPLTSMLLHIQLLGRTIEQGRLDPDEGRHKVAVAETQARRLSALIDDLLDVARLSSNRLVLRVEEVDLRQVVDGLMATLAADFQRAGCTVSVRMPEKVIGRWDRMRIEQVLTNLLSNAMKFGEGRPIEVNVEATATDICISVRDYGIGISPEDRARIFGRFERAVSTRQFGGLGLGLCISVQILRAHRGSLRVESEPGRGSCFIIDLPRGLQRPTSVAELSP